MSESVSCKRCGRTLTDAATGITFASVSVDYSYEAPDSRAAWQRIYPELTLPWTLAICHVCWLNGLGIGPDLNLGSQR